MGVSDMRYITGFVIVVLSFILTGCTTEAPAKENFSGFLSSYDELKVVKSEDNVEVLGWLSPTMKRTFSSCKAV